MRLDDEPIAREAGTEGAPMGGMRTKKGI